MDPRLRNLNIALAGGCACLTLYTAAGGDGVATALWALGALAFLAAAGRVV